MIEAATDCNGRFWITMEGAVITDMARALSEAGQVGQFG
jgi:hypothetical protein